MGSHHQTGGMTSSINLTSMNGIELFNPSFLKKAGEKKERENFFNEESGFRTVMQAKQGSNVQGLFGKK